MPKLNLNDDDGMTPEQTAFYANWRDELVDAYEEAALLYPGDPYYPGKAETLRAQTLAEFCNFTGSLLDI